MKHLHRQFILASAAVGLGMALVLGAVYRIHALPMNGWTPIRTFASAMLATTTGGILLIYGFFGVRQEMYGRKK